MSACTTFLRTHFRAARLAALGLAPFFGVVAAGGLVARTVSAAPHYALIALADDEDEGNDEKTEKNKDAEKDSKAEGAEKSKDADHHKTAEKDKKATSPEICEDCEACEDCDLRTRMESRLKELADQIVKDLGPTGEEIRKVWDRAISRADETLEREGVSGSGLRKAIDDVRDEISAALERGSPVDRKVRRALDRLRGELGEVGEESRRDVRETLRRRFLDDRETSDEAGAGEAGGRDQLDAARKEVRELQGRLNLAVERLKAFQARSDRDGRSSIDRRPPSNENDRRGPDANRGRGGPGASDSDRTEPFRRGRGLRELPQGFGPHEGRGRESFGGPGFNPEGRGRRGDDRRLRELEEKMDGILKRLDRMNAPEKEKEREEAAPKKPEAGV